MRGERQDVSDHPAVREHIGRLAQRVDERLIEPALLGYGPDVVEERRSLHGQRRRIESTGSCCSTDQS